LLWWGRFSGYEKDSSFVRGDFPTMGVTVLVVHVEGEEHLSPDSKGLESGAREPSLLRAHGVYGWVRPTGAPAVMFNARHLEGP
jgi:hypothetical protein